LARAVDAGSAPEVMDGKGILPPGDSNGKQTGKRPGWCARKVQIPASLSNTALADDGVGDGEGWTICAFERGRMGDKALRGKKGEKAWHQPGRPFTGKLKNAKHHEEFAAGGRKQRRERIGKPLRAKCCRSGKSQSRVIGSDYEQLEDEERFRP